MRAYRSLMLGLPLALVLSACGASGVEVRQAGNPDSRGDQAAALADVAEHSPLAVGLMSICVDGASSGELTAVEPIGTDDIEVTAFTVVDAERETFAASRKSLSAEGFDTTAHTVAARCGAEGDDGISRLLVEMERLTPESATTDGFRVHWRADGNEGTFDILFENSICAAGDVACSDI